MNKITKEPCPRCGLIQLKDILFGLAICDSKEALVLGCPPRKAVEAVLPDHLYDEEIYKNRTEKPNFMDLNNE